MENGEKCDFCGKPAKYNYEECGLVYSIDDKGNFDLHELKWCDLSVFYCEECYMEEME